MDCEQMLHELFPQIDARLIRAVLLDGDDMESAIDFLVKENVASHSTKPQPANPANKTNMDICTAIPLELGKDLVTLKGEELIETNCDIYEELIVWKCGVGCQAGLNDHSSDGNIKFAELKYANASGGERLQENYSLRKQQKLGAFETSSMNSSTDSVDSLDSIDFSTDSSDGLPAHDTAKVTVLKYTNALGSEELQEDHPLKKQRKLEAFETSLMAASTDTLDSSDTLDFPKDFVDSSTKPMKKTLETRSIMQELEAGKVLIAPDVDEEDIYSEETVWPNTTKVSQEHAENAAFTGGKNGLIHELENYKVNGNFCSEVMTAQESTENVIRGTKQAIDSSGENNIPIEDLEILVHEAKCCKAKILQEIEDIRLLRLQTEKEEAAAQEAKIAALNGGLKLEKEVLQMRQKVAHEQAENEMRAAEVYGEKAILSTEARGLRSRLLQTQAEQSKALSAIDEIRAVLLARLKAAVQEREIAAKEKNDKERNAQELLAAEQAAIEKVAQVSKELEAEAEVCMKLRDLLIDRGNMVDSLQGEIAVLCEDVEAIKEQIDAGVMLSGSRSFSSKFSTLSEDSPVAAMPNASRIPISFDSMSSASVHSVPSCETISPATNLQIDADYCPSHIFAASVPDFSSSRDSLSPCFVKDTTEGAETELSSKLGDTKFSEASSNSGKDGGHEFVEVLRLDECLLMRAGKDESISTEHVADPKESSEATSKTSDGGWHVQSTEKDWQHDKPDDADWWCGQSEQAD